MRISDWSSDVCSSDLANDRNCVGRAHGVTFQQASQAIAKGTFSPGSIADGCILPKGANLVQERHILPPSYPQRRQRIEDGRMGMQKIRLPDARQFIHLAGQCADLPPFTER